MRPPPSFGVQAAPTSQSHWAETARRCEDLGFDFFCIGDHPGSWPSPFTALGAAAAATTSILLGPYVANSGLRNPMDLATDVATLDIVSDGRAVLGLGAGHTPQEWAMRSRQRPSSEARIERLIATADATRSLLRGDTVSLAGPVRLSHAHLGERLVRPGIPLLIGGNNRELLRYAAEKADIIGLTGLGRTLDGGHRHEVRWSEGELRETFASVSSWRERPTEPEIQVLVQRAEITDDPEGVANHVSSDLDVPTKHVLASPFILLGSVNQIADRVLANADKWGVDSYVVRQSSIDDIGRVIKALDNA